MVLTLRKKKFTIIAIAACAAVLATAFVLLAIPIAQEQSGSMLIGLRLYSFEAESLFGASWSNFTYHGVTFGFHIWCLASPAAGEICGNATESNGKRYAFSFWDGPPSPEPRWETWVAPDANEAAQYQQGGLVHLLVAM